MHDDLQDRLARISQQTVERYSGRYRTMGYDVKTLGWGTAEQQQYRFGRTLTGGIRFDGKSVLDIGCGFGDYRDFLRRQGVSISRYIGWDINQDLVEEARRRHAAEADVRFEQYDLARSPLPREPVADIGIMLGVLNFNLKETLDNYDYSRMTIEKAFRLVRDALVVDFLSTRMTETYPKEDFVFYHRPEAMLEIALSLSPDVVLKHDYAPIPQKEGMLFICKRGE